MLGRRQSTKKLFMRRSATLWMLVASFSGVKTPGYHQTSLRERAANVLCRGAAFHGSPAFQGCGNGITTMSTGHPKAPNQNRIRIFSFSL